MESKQPLLQADQDVKEGHDLAAHVAPPSYEHSSNNATFALMSFHTVDRIRLTRMSQSDVDGLRDCVLANWTAGISHCKPYNASVEIKLKGYPWVTTPACLPQVIKLVQALLSESRRLGWVVDQSIIMLKKAEQKDTLLLRRSQIRTGTNSWFAISFDHASILTIHDGPNDICQALASRLGATQQDLYAECAIVENRFELRLKKAYWLAQGEDTMRARLMLLEIAELLHAYGFDIYASLRLTNTNDVLFCMKENVDVTDSAHGR